MAWPYTIGLDGVATPAPALVKHAPLGDWVGGDRIGSTEQLEQPGGKQHDQSVAGGAVNDTSHFASRQTGTPRSEAVCRRRCCASSSGLHPDRTSVVTGQRVIVRVD